MRNKLQLATQAINEHLEEMKLVIEVADKKSSKMNKQTWKIFSAIAEDAIADANQTLQQLGTQKIKKQNKKSNKA